MSTPSNPEPLTVAAPQAPNIFWHVNRGDARAACFHRKADAELFSAAPDLLAACKSFLAAMKKACELYGPDTPATAGMVTGAIAARAAIAKAEGQKP